MRSLLALALCAAASPVAAASTPQPAPPPPVVVPPLAAPARQIPRTWEEIPAALRERMGRLVHPLAFQSVLKIEPTTLSGEPKEVEAGTELARQWVSPARAVKLTTAPRRAIFGEVGSVLWQARDETGEYWCRLSPPKVFGGYKYYCFQDTNNDGVFDALFGTPADWSYPGFQIFTKGDAETLGTPVSYVPVETPADRREYVVLNYKGVHAGLIADDGHVRPGLVKLELVVGAGPPDRPQRIALVVKTYDVELDQQGRAHIDLPSGFGVTIDQVEVGGRARIAVSGGMPAGEGYLAPAVTRADLLKRLQDMLSTPG